jgi:hypothetical protein
MNLPMFTSRPSVRVAFAVAAVGAAVLAAAMALRAHPASAGTEPSAAQEVTALTAPQTNADFLPADVQSVLREALSGVSQYGSLDESTSRLLSHGVGGDTIYADISTRGQLCEVIGVITAGCIEQFNAEAPVAVNMYDPDSIGSGEPAVLAGIAPDGVTSVTALDDGGPVARASVSNNAFAVQFAPSQDARKIVAIEIQYSDGRAARMPL